MIFLPFLHFFCFCSGIFLGIYILYKDSKSLLNRTLSVLMFCYALWNFGDIIVHNPDRSITVATVEWMQFIASFGWVGFPMATFCFSLAFSKNENLLKKKWFLLIVFLLPPILIYKQFSKCLTINPTQRPYGWSVDWAETIWPDIFVAYFSIFTVLSILLTYSYGRKTKISNEKKQAKVIVYSISFGLIAGALLDVILQRQGIYSIPPIADLLVLFFVIAVLYAINKYRFLTITPNIAAENIISAMDEILILLNHEGNILSVNNAGLNILHYEHKELEGKSITILFQDESFKKIFLENIAGDEAISNHESSFVTKDGKIVPIIYSTSPLKDNEGIVIGNVFVSRDITLHKLIEDELVKSKEKAEESDKLKSAFLANMSHEIRTPMNGILGFADLLKDPDLNDDTQQKYINIIEKSGKRMLNIINDIIDISKIESGLMNIDLKESNINEQIEYIYTFFKPEVEAKGLRFHFKNALSNKQAIIRTDREKIYAVLTNLVKNAIKYTKEGSIEFGYDFITNKDNVDQNLQPKSELRFYVKDTGIGIPKDKLEAVFERFVQTDQSNKMAQQGAGLGLSISKAYVEMLGGKIWVISDVRIGSTIYFTLPYNNAQAEIITENDVLSGRDPVDIEKLKILIAEDDETSKMLISISVEKFSKKIIEVNTGIEAVEICRQNPDIDLILMDFQMPDMDGYEATRQIRKFNNKVIIIGQSAYGLDGDKEKAIDAGCNDYIAKPVSKELLVQLIKKHFNTQGMSIH